MGKIVTDWKLEFTQKKDKRIGIPDSFCISERDNITGKKSCAARL